MRKSKRNWTKEQTIIAFNLYCKIPFQKASSTNPDIIRIAKIIGRSPNSVKMKIGNFGSFDPELKKKGIVGLTNTSKLDKEVWDEFNNDWERLAFESEKLIAELQGKKVEDIAIEETLKIPEGITKKRLVKTRVNQSFFRQSVLSAYNSTCCITGIKIPQLLIASHIIPWHKADDKTEKSNPRNGLCLNALHDKAFDKGFLTVTPDYEIRVSNRLYDIQSNETIKKYFNSINKKKIILPERFLPKKEFLEYHNNNIFENF
jgi:putative restriction endonuclease